MNNPGYDLDPRIYSPTSCLFPSASVLEDSEQFYHQVVRRWLSQHPLLDQAEVRMSGQGLHALLWFEQPVELQSGEDRERWTGIIQVVQAALPVDPDSPHLTACTRALGSVNGKNRARVRRLAQGSAVPAAEVMAFAEEMASQPFSIVMKNLYGSTSVTPCPICGQQTKTLQALGQIGNCYGGCGKVELTDLYDAIYGPRCSPQVGGEACQ